VKIADKERFKKEYARLAEKAMEEARGLSIEFADIRIIRSRHSSVCVQNQCAESLGANISAGAGVRVLYKGAWGFASSEQLDAKSLTHALEQAKALASAASKHAARKIRVTECGPFRGKEITNAREPLQSWDTEKKVKLVLALENAGRGEGGPQIVNSRVRLSESESVEIISNTTGTLVSREDSSLSLISRYAGLTDRLRQEATQVQAFRCGAEGFSRLNPETTTIEAARKVKRLLASRPAPSGVFPVVFSPTITGLLVHEAIGHNAEADSTITGQSIFGGRLGTRIGPDSVTIVDDPTIPGSYGSYEYDSEGTPSRKKIIIQNGRLVNFLHSLETAAACSIEPDGSARAEDYSMQPIVRMSNTFMEPGAPSLEEMLSGIDRGVYLEDGHWGYVFVDKGQFTCHAGAGRLIENGKLGPYLRDVCVSGMIFDALINIKAVSNDFEMNMPGRCEKSGQDIPINGGGPHVLIDDIVVGGQDG